LKYRWLQLKRESLSAAGGRMICNYFKDLAGLSVKANGAKLWPLSMMA
jgi:hypothetical protein